MPPEPAAEPVAAPVAAREPPCRPARSLRTAHDVSGPRTRTGDVLLVEPADFESLLLSRPVLDGLRAAGFERPSPVQLKAIPLGRCGLGEGGTPGRRGLGAGGEAEGARVQASVNGPGCSGGAGSGAKLVAARCTLARGSRLEGTDGRVGSRARALLGAACVRRGEGSRRGGARWWFLEAPGFTFRPSAPPGSIV